MEFLIWFVSGAITFLAFIAIHETGHYAAARLIGVPSGQVAIRLNQWPVHVALKTDDHWWAPGSEGYDDAYARHDPKLRWLGAFIAAGFLLQAAVMLVSSGVLTSVGLDDFASRVVRISAVLNGLYLIADLAGTASTRSPAGDMSSLLQHAPRIGVATLLVVIGAHLTAVGLNA